MQKNIIKSLLIIIAFTFALSANYIFAVWTGPTQAPPGGNTPTPVHVGTTPQLKDGALSLNSLAVFGAGFFDGNVGIGVTNPQAKLDVAGKIRVGDDTQTPIAGAIRWTGIDFEGYNGTEWKSLTASSVTTQAGLPFYGTNSTAESTTRKEECQTAGGTVTDFQANSFCKFQASSCQSGWTRYENLGSTSTNSCTGASDMDCPATTCTTGNHNFANISPETCAYYDAGMDGNNSDNCALWGFGDWYGGAGKKPSRTCAASLIEVGCY